MRFFFIITVLALVFTGCFFGTGFQKNEEKKSSLTIPSNAKTAIFAGGCFWCVEEAFEKYSDHGVVQVISGFTGGPEENPTYEQVASGNTGHVEAVQVIYDPEKITYNDLLEIFWRQIDPTDNGGSFVDRGSQYRSAIFYATDEERFAAETSKVRLTQSAKYEHPIVTEIRKEETFYPAPEYHQDFYKNNPLRYTQYKNGSGRPAYREKVWGKDKDYVVPEQVTMKEGIKNKLTPLQYYVTQEQGTEPPFKNEYWDNTAEGLYVDIVSGEPLFSSLDKYDSGTGWPSFTKPLFATAVTTHTDGVLMFERTEVRSAKADSHLGHVFSDGPPPTGLRYCMNSAALRFIAVADLEKEGYTEYLGLFTGKK